MPLVPAFLTDYRLPVIPLVSGKPAVTGRERRQRLPSVGLDCGGAPQAVFLCSSSALPGWKTAKLSPDLFLFLSAFRLFVRLEKLPLFAVAFSRVPPVFPHNFPLIVDPCGDFQLNTTKLIDCTTQSNAWTFFQSISFLFFFLPLKLSSGGSSVSLSLFRLCLV